MTTPEEIDLRSLHSRKSQLRERIVEFVFMGRLMRRLWQRRVTDVEILRSDFDAFGYDLVLTHGPIVRHVQLKTVLDDGSTREWKIAMELANKPSGCVVVCVVSLDLDLKSFLWLGGAPAAPLTFPDGLKVARHTKGTSHGEKLERPAHRVVPRRHFSGPFDIDELTERLFGTITKDVAEASSHPQSKPA